MKTSYSIAKFGSQLGSNFDKYSDKDLLVVSESYDELLELSQEYSTLGWSVSCYTYDKLKYLSRKGSLFVSHLKSESVILFDPSNRLKQILTQHKHKKNYDVEFQESKDYFKIMHIIPDSLLGYAWFADCFYVGLRNYLIFANANNGIFDFSYLSLVKRLFVTSKITEEEYLILRNLRIVKFNYRNDFMDDLPGKSFVKSLINIANHLDIQLKCSFVSPNVFSSVISDLIYNKTTNGYQRLRIVEGVYCASGINSIEIKRIITNPQFYASKLLDNRIIDNLLATLRTSKYNHVEKILECL